MKQSLYLPVYENNFLEDNRELLPALVDGRANIRHASAFCTNFRRAAIAALLQTGRSRVFRLRLHRSARAWVHFLGFIAEVDKRTSASFPLLDAIGSGDFGSATEIAKLSRHEWVQDEEYEEDYLFHEFIMQSALLDASYERAAALLDRWEACLGNSEDLRLPVCRALFAADESAFDEALRAWLEERAQEFADNEDTFEPESLATEASVSIEGLALLRLASRKGMTLDRDYQHVPSVAREDEPLTWKPSSFTEVS
jgi:hypothetical protein